MKIENGTRMSNIGEDTENRNNSIFKYWVDKINKTQWRVLEYLVVEEPHAHKQCKHICIAKEEKEITQLENGRFSKNSIEFISFVHHFDISFWAHCYLLLRYSSFEHFSQPQHDAACLFSNFTFNIWYEYPFFRALLSWKTHRNGLDEIQYGANILGLCMPHKDLCSFTPLTCFDFVLLLVARFTPKISKHNRTISIQWLLKLNIACRRSISPNQSIIYKWKTTEVRE